MNNNQSNKEKGEKRQPADIAKANNKDTVLSASDGLKITSKYYGGIFAETENIDGNKGYSKIPISLLATGGSKKNVTFYLDVDEAEYLYEFSKAFSDCSYSSYKERNGVRRTLLIKRQSFYNNQKMKYPWYIEIKNMQLETKNGKTEIKKTEKRSINISDKDFFTVMNRIHRFIHCFVNAYSTNIIRMKLEYEKEQNWRR